MSLDVLHASVVLGSAFLGAALNAAAGGGSFLTLPALLWAGVAPVAANATGTTALLPGYLSSAWGFRADIAQPRAVGMRTLLIICLIGGASGAGVLVLTSNTGFRALVPWLLLFGTAMFAFGPALLRALGRHPQQVPSQWQAIGGLLAVSLYGGYFNGGLGVLLLALFGVMGETELNRMNGLKNLVSAVLTIFAVTIYAAADKVQWLLVVLMMPAVLLGGYMGARMARKIPPRYLRWGIVFTGLVMAALFFR